MAVRYKRGCARTRDNFVFLWVIRLTYNLTPRSMKYEQANSDHGEVYQMPVNTMFRDRGILCWPLNLGSGGLYSMSEAIFIAMLVFLFVGAIDLLDTMPRLVNRAGTSSGIES